MFFNEVLPFRIVNFFLPQSIYYYQEISNTQSYKYYFVNMSKYTRKKAEQSSDDNESDKASEESIQEVVEEQFNFKELPAHACNYCGIHDPSSVVKCLGKNCNKWFCNSKGEKSGNASHIAIHLIKAKHNQIGVHPDSQLGNIDIQCYRCGNANIFVLGYVKINDGEDEAVLILCRMPCVEQENYGDIKWDRKDWNPLLNNKQIVNIFCQKPPLEMMKKMRNIQLEQIMKLEEVWKTNPAAKYEDLNKKKLQKKLRPLKLKYKDGEEYRRIFETLLTQQAETDKKIKQGQTQNNITLRFQNTSKNRLYAYFVFASKEDYDTSLLPGNQLKLSIKTEKYDWSSKGIVLRIMGNEQVCLELANNNPPPVDSGYKVQFVWKSTSYNRMKRGLRRFAKQSKSISGYLYYRILGHDRQKPNWTIDTPKNLSAPGLPKLNFYQQEAVRKALVQPLCLIQGPPGTGKTITSASIVYQLVCNMRNIEKRGQVLVCAPSNVVVDMLAEKIALTGLKVVRFCSKLRQNVSSSVQYLTLHNLVRNLKGQKYERLRGYYKSVDQQKLAHEDEDKFQKQKKRAELDVLTNADVICCTCIASADRRIRDFTFYNVLIDQATQAIQAECLLPMLKSAKQVILVGDHLQLGPVVICRDTSKAGLNRSLFQRFVLMGHRPLRLQVQYRMHPSLTYFPSNTFYEGTLQNGITQNDRKLNAKFPWPQNKPLFFLNLYGSQEISASGTSYLNRTQAAAVEKIVFHMQRSGILANQIGIITPYKGQRAYIINYLQKNGQLLATNPNFYKQIEIASVDGYQGRQKDYIIISCVRSNEGTGIGFLTDPRRLNVTITRAKYGMIVIGNAKVLYKDNLWNNLLNHFKKQGTLVQGSIPNFRQSPLSFPTPQKYVPEKKTTYPDQDTKSQYNYDNNDQLNNFDFLYDAPINSGFRYSALGYNQIPEVASFTKSKLFDIFSKKDAPAEESFLKNGEFIIPSANLDLGLDQ